MVTCYVGLEVLGVAGSGRRSNYDALNACFEGGPECVDNGFVKIVEDFLVSSATV